MIPFHYKGQAQEVKTQRATDRKWYRNFWQKKIDAMRMKADPKMATVLREDLAYARQYGVV